MSAPLILDLAGSPVIPGVRWLHITKKRISSMWENTCYRLLVCSLIIFCWTIPAYSQKFWEKKPYQQWSEKEALQIITDSPWAKTLDLMKEKEKFSTKPGTVLDDPYPSIVAISVRLRSALLVRQAFVRQKQISIKYDKLGAADKAKFDAAAKEFLDCPPCAKYYIVSIDSQFLNSRRRTFPEEYSLDALQARAFLGNDEGERRPCVHISEDNQELLFFFPRLNSEGKPLVTSNNKEFYFTLQGKASDQRLKLTSAETFDVAKLTLNGEIVF